jgi:hypothetical protein
LLGVPAPAPEELVELPEEPELELGLLGVPALAPEDVVELVRFVELV